MAEHLEGSEAVAPGIFAEEDERHQYEQRKAPELERLPEQPSQRPLKAAQGEAAAIFGDGKPGDDKIQPAI